MILVTHGIVGASIALSMPNSPVLGAVLAFASHFLLDAIPHWDYELKSLESQKDPLLTKIIRNHHLYPDMCRVAFDGLLGLSLPLVIMFLLVGNHLYIALLGAVFAILPDFFQFLFFKTKAKWLGWYIKFHNLVHSKKRFDGRPGIGIVMQVGIWAIAIVAVALI